MVDPMHNLLLGTAKNMMTIWKDSGLLSATAFEKIQQQVDAINLPAGIGRVPGKIAAGFSNFTAEQWKTWTVVLSRYVLKEVLPTRDFKVWCLFAEACSIICRPILHISHVEQADNLLLKFLSFCMGKRDAHPICTYMATLEILYWMLVLFILFGVFPLNATMGHAENMASPRSSTFQ